MPRSGAAGAGEAEERRWEVPHGGRVGSSPQREGRGCAAIAFGALDAYGVERRTCRWRCASSVRRKGVGRVGGAPVSMVAGGSGGPTHQSSCAGPAIKDSDCVD